MSLKTSVQCSCKFWYPIRPLLWRLRILIDGWDKKCLLAYILHLFLYLFSCFIQYFVIKESLYWIDRAFLTHSVTCLRLRYAKTFIWINAYYVLRKRAYILLFWGFELNWTYVIGRIYQKDWTHDWTQFLIFLDCPSLIHTFYGTHAALQINILNNFSTSKAEKKHTYIKYLTESLIKKWNLWFIRWNANTFKYLRYIETFNIFF